MRYVIFDYYFIEFGTSLFISQRICTVYFGNKEKNWVTLPHSAQRKHEFCGEIKQISKSKKIEPRKKIALGLLHHRLGHRSNRSFMDVDTENVWKDN